MQILSLPTSALPTSAVRMVQTRRSRSTGQAIIEFALVLPLAMLLIVGIGDFARLYTTSITIESAVREAADYGAFQGSNWLAANIGITESGMQERACTAASTLPDYVTTNPNFTCTNPTVTYALVNPDAIDCSAPVPPSKRPCIVHVMGHFDFRLFLGGAGIAGIFTLPSTVPIDRDVSFVVNDFPSP